MAIFRKGILGGFSGLAGSIVGSSWKGLDVFKSRPKPSTKPRTEAQLSHQSRFKLVMRFLGRMDQIIKTGYGSSVKGNVTPMNVAFVYHQEHAITGVYPNFMLDYSKVRLSDESAGKIQGFPEFEVTPLPEYKVKFDWTNYEMNDGSLLSDVVVALFYNPVRDQFYSMAPGQVRSAQTFTFSVPRLFSGHKLHGWAFFVSADGKRASTTTYLGEVTILE